MKPTKQRENKMRTLLSTKTFGKTAKKEVFAQLQNARKIQKLHVSGVGYVYYIKDAANNVIAKCYKENLISKTKMVLEVS